MTWNLPPGTTGLEPELTGVYPCDDCGGWIDSDCPVCDARICRACGCWQCAENEDAA